MAAQTQPRLTPEEYLEIERAAEFRHEYYNGRMYAMAGGSVRHAIIIGNLAGELHAALKKRPCIVTTNDLRICVSSEGLYTYPDIAVVCGEPKFLDGGTDTLLNPVLLLEVLSPSTELLDREFKALQYRMIEALREYALVSQTEARVEVFRRQDGGQWLSSEFIGLEGVAKFESVGASIPLADIYAKVRFGEEGANRLSYD